MKKFLLSLPAIVTAFIAAPAQDLETSTVASQPEIKKEEPKFKVVPSGRVLVDGALYASPEKQLFKDGLAIPEARLGAKMSYGNWSSWIDVGFAYGKIGLRNMWIQYNFNDNNAIRFGNFIQPFGLQSTTSLSLKCTYEQPLASALYTPGIQLGAMYTHYNPSFYGAAAFHVESSALTNVMNYPQFNQQGYSLLTRLVWREKSSGINGKPVIQAGISGGFSTPQRTLEGDKDVHNGFAISGNYPTKVTTLEAIGVNIGNARNMFKLSPELLLSYGKLALEGQYFYQRINRWKGYRAFTSQGGYVTLRGMLIGGKYTYDSANGQVVAPNKNSLECVLNYNYATLSDSKAKIYGGRANSFNATLNYYINPYITARLNYTYTHTWNREGFDPTTLNGFQARLMVLF